MRAMTFPNVRRHIRRFQGICGELWSADGWPLLTPVITMLCLFGDIICLSCITLVPLRMRGFVVIMTT